MEAKIIELIKACCDDKEMLSDNQKLRITTEMAYLRTIACTHDGERVWTGKKHIFNTPLEGDNTRLEGIILEFEKAPMIFVRPKVKSVTHKKYQIDGILKLKWRMKKSVKIDVVEHTYEVTYEVTCGEYKFDIDKEIVEELVRIIPINRSKYKKRLESEELTRRFMKYGIGKTKGRIEE